MTNVTLCRMAYCGKPQRDGGTYCEECSKHHRCQVCRDNDADIALGGGRQFCADCVMTGGAKQAP